MPVSKVETITTPQLAKLVGDKHSLPHKAAKAIVEEIVQVVFKAMKKGIKVRINGLGIFQVKQLKARMGRNPATGEKIKIKARKKLNFRPAKELKDMVKSLPASGGK